MRPFALLVPALLLACSSTTGPEAVGTWGGTYASLTLSRSGGTLGYACGAGSVAAGWTLDATGKFSGTGVHYVGGGPMPPTGRTPHPASYSGRVNGDVFDLAVTVPDLDLTIGPFRMVRGGPAVAEICV